MDRLAWPREHQALQYVLHLLRTGDAGPVEDVLLVP
jgi:dATP pyrophosphohydrolase